MQKTALSIQTRKVFASNCITEFEKKYADYTG